MGFGPWLLRLAVGRAEGEKSSFCTRGKSDLVEYGTQLFPLKALRVVEFLLHFPGRERAIAEDVNMVSHATGGYLIII